MFYASELLMLFAAEDRRGETNQTIARYCLAHLDQMQEETITHLAEVCHVSPATITRFCHALGYDDFLHFKDECRRNFDACGEPFEHSVKMLGADAAPFAPDALPATGAALGKSVAQGLLGVDQALLGRLADDLHRAPDVLWLGMDYSSLIVLYLQMELYKAGKISRVLRDTSGLESVQAGPDTLPVFLSLNGFGLDSMEEVLGRLRGRCRCFWLITQSVPAENAPFASHILRVGSGCAAAYQRYLELALADRLLAEYRRRYHPDGLFFKK